MNTNETMAISLVVSAWQRGIQSIDKSLVALTDDDLNSEIRPGRNKGSWIVGHLAATIDNLSDILGLGGKTNPEYERYFTKGDESLVPPTINEILKYWQDTSMGSIKKIAAISSDEWFQKHNNISEEDFKAQPARNKLSVLVSRTIHLAHHNGQLTLLINKKQA